MMLSRLLYAALVTVGTAVGAAAIGGQAQAGILLTEDFAGATPGTYGGGAIPGTVFTVTTANVDIGGQLNGSFFSCFDNAAGNCLDLVGNQGAGAIASNSTFNLKAGSTYTVKFGATQQDPSGGNVSDTFSVSLGTLMETETVATAYAPLQFSLTFTPTTAQSGAALAFTNIVAPDSSHGAVLDHISLTESVATGAVPEPASWALMLTGFGAIGGVMRRRATTVSVAA